jgi:hypothetical protein
MKTSRAVLVLVAACIASAAAAQEPDYSAWAAMLNSYYNPQIGMDYKALKAKELPALKALSARLAQVNPAALSPQARLAYWINVYNVNTVRIVAENYPVDSIRDISTDPVIRLNVFKKDYVPFGRGTMSLNDVENEKIRDGFKDPRIHFAINCAAASCPSIRTEPFVGAQISAQLDDQSRRFLNGPKGVRMERKGNTLVIHTTKIMDWFGEDFDKWGGGRVAFIRKYVPADKQRMIDQAGKNVRLEYDDYDWSLNDWKR